MTTFTDVFGNSTVPPAEYGYSRVVLTDVGALSTQFVWPYNTDSADYVISKILDIVGDPDYAPGTSITLPDATEVSTGEDFLITNGGAYNIIVFDKSGVQVATITPGASKYFYLRNNTTSAGVFGVVNYGVGTSVVDASSLIGYGIKAISASLNQSHPVVPTNTGLYIDVDHRAKLIVFTGGVATFNLTSAATLGDDYFTLFRNEGTGTVTLDPYSSETLDGMTTMQVQPGESLMLVCTGTQWYSVGYGRSTLYQFTQLTKDVSAGGTITLSAAEAANKLITFIGNPAGAVNVVVPGVVAVYYTQSSISTAQTVTLKTASGSGVGISQGARIIALCDGTNVVSAQSAVANTSVSLTDGSSAVPSLFFATQTNTGLYKSGTQDVGVTVNGSTVGVFGSTGLQTSTIGPNSTQRHTLPAVTSDTVTLNAASQTLSNKSIALGSNTLTGTKAQFDTALSDDNFAYLSTANTFNTNQTISVNSASDALRITQTGSGNAIVVEDSATPDSTPFVVNSLGNVTLGSGVAGSTALTVNGSISAISANPTGYNALLNSTNVTTGQSAIVQTNDGLVFVNGIEGITAGSMCTGSQAYSALLFTSGLQPIQFGTNTLIRMTIEGAGRIGIGGTNPSNYLTVTGSVPTTGIGTRVYGNSASIPSTTTSWAVGFHSEVKTDTSSFTLTELSHFKAQPATFGAGSTVTSQYGFFADNSLTGATNNYGFYSNVPSGTGRWNFYANGTADNYFGGKVGIGATGSTASFSVALSTSNASPSVASFGGALTPTGTTQSGGINVSPTVTPSGASLGSHYNVTSDATFNNAVLPTILYGYFSRGQLGAASSGAIGNLYSYAALGPVIGGAGTVTNFYGFTVPFDVSTATNVYGIHSKINAGATKYNLYMESSAANYMNGPLHVGFPSTGQLYGVRVARGLTGATGVYQITSEGSVQSDVTNAYYSYLSFPQTVATAFTLNNLYHYAASQNTIGVGSTVTNQYGFRTESNMVGATNNFGFSSNIPSGTGRWNFYAGGTADNYFAGSVGIGGVPFTGAKTVVSGSATGATTAYSLQLSQTAQSDVTNSLNVVATYPSTAASAFTLNALRHFYAIQGTIGAGSAVTYQYGFVADAGLIGATNNYGFYSNIASGTGRWNFYAAGTAKNYFAGECDHASNLNFTGTGNRITGDFSNATHGNRVLLQSSITNGNTAVGAIPNGTATSSFLAAYNNSDANNSAFMFVSAGSADCRLTAGQVGTGTYLPMAFWVNNAERMRIDTSGNISASSANASAGTSFNLTNTSTAAGSQAEVRVTQGAVASVLNCYNNTLSYIGTISNHPVAFLTNNMERMRIDTSGNVVVGATSGGFKFNVQNTSATSTTPFSNIIGGFLANASGADCSLILSDGVANSAKISMVGAKLAFDHNGTKGFIADSTGAFGYGTGSGGTVTQATSKSTAVTLNKPTGKITLNASALGAGANAQFAVNNSLVTQNDTIILTCEGAAVGNYRAEPFFAGSAQFGIRVTNITGGSLSESFNINFAIIKGATS